MKEFIELEQYGMLYIDKVLIESYYPVVFTCKNEHKEIFICVCCQSNEKGCRWLLGKTRGKSIVKMLRDEISIRQLLMDCTSDQVSIHYVDGVYKKEAGGSDWNPDSPYLPKKDSYMYAEDGEFDDEIKYFTEIDDWNMDSEYTLQVHTEDVELSDIEETIYDMEADTIPSQVNLIMSCYTCTFSEILSNGVLEETEKIGSQEYKSQYRFNVDKQSRFLAKEDISDMKETDYYVFVAA